jgi:hypothetical protein
MDKRFKKVVIWGYPLDTHTHSYIHYAFEKAFKFLGYETLWLNNDSNITGIDFNNSLFFVSGDQDKNIPVLSNSYYILHNVDSRKYFNANCKKIFLQVFNKCTSEMNGIEKVNNHTFFDRISNCLFMPWATDLLPHEIDLNNANNQTDNKNCVWIGTYGGGNGIYENESVINPFFEECKKNKIKIICITPWANEECRNKNNKIFKESKTNIELIKKLQTDDIKTWYYPTSFEENRMLINNAYLAPTLQGQWQIDSWYIPCRIFKNISYGHLGITNSKAVSDIFNGELIYDTNSVELFNKSIEKKNNSDCLDWIKYLMNEVKTKHTYINRVEEILKFL